MRRKSVFILFGLMVTFGLMTYGVAAQDGSMIGGLGVGNFPGLEVGINLDAIAQIRAEVNNGVYDRACTAAEHNPYRWHPLVNDELKCHYNHHHGDDPNYVNDIFGAPGEWFGVNHQSLSYPWQTFPTDDRYASPEAASAAGMMENQMKHEGYMWIVRRNQPCPNEGEGCTTDFRLQYHGAFGAIEAGTRWHSYSYEGRVCGNANDPNTCGIVRLGGWTDFGRLFVTEPGVLSCNHDVKPIFISMGNENQFFPLDRPDSRDEVRCHTSVIELPAEYPYHQPLGEWWSFQRGRFRFQLRVFDPIGPVSIDDPTRFDFFCTEEDVNCRYNQSYTSAWIGYITAVPEFADYCTFGCQRVDANGDGRADFRGFTNRMGELVQGCTTASLDCVPLVYEGFTMNGVFANNESGFIHHPCETCERVNLDLSPADKKWVTWFYDMYKDDDANPTPEPPVVPTTPAVVVNVEPASANIGETVSVGLDVHNISGLYGLQAECRVNPAVLQGQTRTGGAGFNDSNSFFVDSGFSAEGVWTVAASRLQPHPAINEALRAFTLNYSVLSVGDPNLTCDILAVDENGRKLDIDVVIGGIVVTDPGGETPVTPMPPTPAPEPLPTSTPDVSLPTTLSGVASYQSWPDNAGIRVRLLAQDGSLVAEHTTGPDGAYRFEDIPVGVYGVLFTAPLHIPVAELVTVDVAGLALEQNAVLPAGDTNDDGFINALDATFVGSNFGLTVPPAPVNADLNGDGIVNISDLVLIGGNYGLESPLNGFE